MKIVFTTIPMKEQIEKLKYPVEGNIDLEYESPVIFPVNAVLAKKLQKGEKVKVVQLMNDSASSKKNAEVFRTELRHLNEKINANISFFEVCEAFEENKKTHEIRFRKLLDYLEFFVIRILIYNLLPI